MSVGQKLRGNWLITVPLVGLTVGYVWLFHMPARRTCTQLRSELAMSQASVAQGPLILAQIAQTETQLAKANEFVEDWRESSPPSAGSAVLLGEISRLARDAGTRTTRLEPVKSEDREELRTLALTLVCQGSFEQAFELLRGIEGMPQSIWIDEVRIERKAGKGEGVQCEVKLAVFAGKSKISD